MLPTSASRGIASASSCASDTNETRPNIPALSGCSRLLSIVISTGYVCPSSAFALIDVVRPSNVTPG